MKSTIETVISLFIFILVYSISTSIPASASNLQKSIGGMLIVGFFGTSAKPNSQICKDIRRYNLGGVILFERNPIDPKKVKNISSPSQLKRLTEELQSCSPNHNLLIAVDQEGGMVQRLKSKYGFYGKYPRASKVSKVGFKYASSIYEQMAKELKSCGVNFNLAPVVDLAINPKNVVINRYGRAFGRNPKVVSKYAKVFIDKMHKYGILTSLKHFPGHGSSLKDTHKGFVDVSKVWQRDELSPYLLLRNLTDAVMVAHIFNSKIDPKYPTSLSTRSINRLLRKKIGFKGVVITDDLQMGAITRIYGLKKTLQLAINAGNDLLLFGNQLNRKNMVSIAKLVKTIEELVREKKVSIGTIRKANRRVTILKRRVR
jgi:beta-N-acetylhexosaminidase